MKERISGKILNEQWKIGARHVLYNHNGIWYHQLRRFPGALCDSQGYVLFQTKDDFLKCSFLRINKDVACRVGIQQIPGYVYCEVQPAIDVALPTRPERVNQGGSRIIRDTSLSSEIKLLYGHTCQLCGAEVKLLRRSYSEAHHIKPLGNPHDGPDTTNNLVCVCPNCHVLLDYAAISLSSDSFKSLKHKISQESIDYHNALHQKAISGLKV